MLGRIRFEARHDVFERGNERWDERPNEAQEIVTLISLRILTHLMCGRETFGDV